MDESEILKLSTESRITGHLRPTTLPNKEMYLRDLHNISDSFVGRVDTLFLNGFIFECEILVINAMELYEKGYFDCACYSLRQAVELANNMIYFSELSDSQRDAEFKKWQLNEKLEAKKVGNFLNSYADNFIETKKVFNINFNKMKDVKQKLNTVVHKQGVNTFYYYLQANQSKNIVPVADFQRYIESVISTVAIIRLSVDPIPVLLLDEDMYFRLPDLMTDPFSFDFIKTYLGESAIHQYKKTDFYKGYYDDILKNKRMNQAVCEIVKYQFININRYDEIVEQIDLLSGLDRVAVVIASASPKISNIYLYNGLLWYHTTTKSKRGSYLHSSAEIASFTKESTTFNQPYSNVFMSFVLHNDLNEIAVYIEHNNKLSDDEMAMICTSYALLAEQFTPILGQEL